MTPLVTPQVAPVADQTASPSAAKSRFGRKGEEKTAQARAYLLTNPQASGSEIARVLGASETQGKLYRKRALEQLTETEAARPE